MANKKDPQKEGSIIQEIESQLEDILQQKKESVEKELQEKIHWEQEEAKRRMEAIEQEMAQEKDALVSFQQFFAAYDTNKVELKQKIKDHLDRAVELQTDIEAKTALTMDELRKVSELNQQLEALFRETQERAETMKGDLETKFGIVATVPVAEEEEVKTHLEKELDRLGKIKELLEAGESIDISTEKEETKASFARQERVETEDVQAEPDAETLPEEGMPGTDQMPETVGYPEAEQVETAPVEGEQFPEGEQAETEPVEGEQLPEGDQMETEAPAEGEYVPEGEQVETEAVEGEQAEGQAVEQAEGMEIGTVGDEEEVPERETEIIPFEAEAKEEGEAEGEVSVEEQTEEAAAEEIPEEGGEVEYVEESAEEGAEEAAEVTGLQAEGEDLQLLDTLEQYRETEGRKGEGEISYFVNEDRKTLDGEYIIAAIGTSVDEAKKLYVKLTGTESPKDQFFVKQEIIRHQEAVRKLMLSCLRLCEKDPEFLPGFTQDILNVDVFKNILEKVSMENWSNQEDFTSFDEFARGIKDDFYARITPPAEYLQSIIQELKIQTG